MIFSRLLKPIYAVLVILPLFFLACDKEYHSIGADLLSDTSLKGNSFTAPIYTYQKKLNYFQTDGLPLGQLGRFRSPGFGFSRASITAQLRYDGLPFFGNYTQ